MSDAKAERGQQWLERLLQLAGLPAQVDVTCQDDAYWLTIESSALTPEQVSALVGEGGKAIDSIQYLANAILNMGCDEELQAAYTLELAGYRQKRQEELRSKAEEVARQVRETGESIEIADLSGAERRQIHTLLKDSEDLETFSRGQEPHRTLVVRLR
ncbi:protein jag [Baaleninema sp.]|uniref:Jag family protein n=1 Tax=Baaleninema sp. TaxID=3101197 RepID=UPI003D035868